MSTTVPQLPTGTYGRGSRPLELRLRREVQRPGLPLQHLRQRRRAARRRQARRLGRGHVDLDRDAQLQAPTSTSDEFFNVKLTDVTFRSEEIGLNEDGTGEVAGDLTIRGVTSPSRPRHLSPPAATPSATTASPRARDHGRPPRVRPQLGDGGPTARGAGLRRDHSSTCSSSSRPEPCASSASPGASVAARTTRAPPGGSDSLPSGAELEASTAWADLPHYDADIDADPAPRPSPGLREAIAGADGVLIATPEFNASIPGALKNALDWASRPFPTTP